MNGLRKLLAKPTQSPATPQDACGTCAWQHQASLWRQKLGVPKKLSLWTQNPDFVGQGLPQTERVRELVNLAAMQAVGGTLQTISQAKSDRKFLKKQVANLVLDVSQNPERHAFTKQGKFPCLTTSSSLYWYARDGMLVPLEHMLLQGHRRTLTIPKSMTPKSLRHLAGEGMSLPCLGLIVWCMAMTKQFP